MITEVSKMNIERLKEIREDKDLNQIDVAKALGIQQQFSEYEIGKRLIPITYLYDLAEFYNTSLDYLVGRIDEISCLILMFMMRMSFYSILISYRIFKYKVFKWH